MSKQYNVFTLGDALITFNPSDARPLRYVPSFMRKVGGAELNFAIGCARLGLEEMNLDASSIISHAAKASICQKSSL